MARSIAHSGYKAESKRGGLWLALILIIFIIAAITYGGDITPSEQSVADNFNSLIYAFSSLINGGGIEAFFDNLIAGLPLIGVFLVVWAIVHFLFSTIFKNLFKKNHVTLLSFALACYGLFDHRIYNWMLALNTFAIAGIIFLAGIIMMWGLTDKGMAGIEQQQRELKPLKQESRRAKQNLKLSRNELRKLERDLGVPPSERKNFHKELKRQGRL
jgi:divalent metal cation (Fe/Co/Zn/Cd) transporter